MADEDFLSFFNVRDIFPTSHKISLSNARTGKRNEALEIVGDNLTIIRNDATDLEIAFNKPSEWFTIPQFSFGSGNVVFKLKFNLLFLKHSAVSGGILQFIVGLPEKVEYNLSGIYKIGKYQATPTTLSDGDEAYLLIDNQGRALIDLVRIGGTAQTGRDWSNDLAKLDITISALRDALRGANTKDFSTLEADLEKLIPISKAQLFNTAVTGGTNIFASDISPTNTPTHFRIYACFDTAGVLSVQRTVGATTISENLNEGANLTANSPYLFDIVVDSGETINLQYSVNATALKISVIEISGGA